MHWRKDTGCKMIGIRREGKQKSVYPLFLFFLKEKNSKIDEYYMM
jgi:hypothetical protein